MQATRPPERALGGRAAEAKPPCREHGKLDQCGEQDQQGQAREDDPADEDVCLFALRRDDEGRLAQVRGQVMSWVQPTYTT
ncbi:MAG TPA: hypothetical protein VHZ03_22605 [Trebonia sp.]|jgi:hypothetical protein|nr:hypothetical protein [Trebonia sp.]